MTSSSLRPSSAVCMPPRCFTPKNSVMRDKKVTKVRPAIGIPYFCSPSNVAPSNAPPSLLTGVAWTAAGGDVMFVEVTVMPGKGSLTMTGQLGDVMQESAQAAMSYLRSHSSTWEIDDEIFENSDVHIHIPEGAVPKDGPSAGVSMATALVSAFTNRPVRRHVGMTGEITLRGRVLAVGGIREKALAARRVGIKQFVLPTKNANDMLEIPKKLRQDLEFIQVDRVNQVLDAALLPIQQSKKKVHPRAESTSLPATSVPPA